MIYLQHDAEHWEDAEKVVRAMGGDRWSIGLGRWPDRAARSRELATWVEDEYRALEGGYRRKVPLDDRGMFPSRTV